MDSIGQHLWGLELCSAGLGKLEKRNKAHLNFLTTCNHFKSVHRTLPHPLSRCRHAELPFQPAGLLCVATEEGAIHSRWEERNTSPLTIWLTAVSCAKKSDPPHPTLPILNPPTDFWKSRSVSHTSRVTSWIKLEWRAERQEIHWDIRRKRGGQAVGGLWNKWREEQRKKGTAQVNKEAGGAIQ